MKVKKISSVLVLLVFVITSCKREEVLNYHYKNSTSANIEIVEYRDSIGARSYTLEANEESIESSGVLTRGCGVFRMNNVDSLQMIFKEGKSLTFYKTPFAEVDSVGNPVPALEKDEYFSQVVQGYNSGELKNILMEENWSLETEFGEEKIRKYYFEITDAYLKHVR